jgi:hypothetical protein
METQRKDELIIAISKIKNFIWFNPSYFSEEDKKNICIIEDKIKE